MTCQYTSLTERQDAFLLPSPLPFHDTETQPEEMEPAAAAVESPDPPPSPPLEGPSPAETSSSPAAAPGTQSPAPAPPGTREVAAAMEAVERDAAAIAESYASLFASLRVALNNVTSTSAENIECLGDVVGRLQESALEASSKGNKYINSCLRLNEEMRGLESLAMQLKTLRKNVDSLDLAVNQLLRLP
uniref:BLOC-1-related complex subunit 6 C-terminal helix domain-containing protein n=3 Tax=Setaria TaxID=4554 RepID=K3ZX71_SETIT